MLSFNTQERFITSAPELIASTAQSDNAPALTSFSAALSPEQERFTELVKQAEALAERIQSLRLLVDSHRTKHFGTLLPLKSRLAGYQRDMVLWLDLRVKSKSLTTKQQRLLRRMICNMALEFAMDGDEEMRILHDAYSDETLAEIQQAQAAEAQAYFEEMMGQSLGEDKPFETVDDVLHARFEKIRKQAEAREKAKESRKNKRSKHANQQDSEQLLDDADSALRTIYRQLASALHPDRESDPAVRTFKTQLMSTANTAYKRRDLLALLQLQYQANLTDAKIAASLAHEKIASLTVLLTERMRAMHRELRDIELQAASEFVLAPSTIIHEASLKHHLKTLERKLQDEINEVKQNMTSIQTDAGLKRWLKEQDEPL